MQLNTKPHVSALWIYPIKSCAGISVDSLEIGINGPKFDRQYVLVDDQMTFLTQRALPQMAHIMTSVLPESEHVEVRFKTKQSLGELVIAATDFIKSNHSITIWRDQPLVHLAHEGINSWFSAALGVSCKLAKLSSPDARTRRRSSVDSPEFAVQFADGAPMLLVNQSSLSHLIEGCKQHLEVERFRANIIIEGASAFAEDNWHKFSVGPIAIKYVWPCSRCVITTMDPNTLERSPEPLNYFRKHRASKDGLCFGINLVHDNCGTIRIGDPIIC